jgi:hypothetical protein
MIKQANLRSKGIKETNLEHARQRLKDKGMQATWVQLLWACVYNILERRERREIVTTSRSCFEGVL